MTSTVDRHRSISQDLPVIYIHDSRVSEWLPDIPSSLVKRLSGSERLHPRLSQIIIQHYRLEALPPFNGDIDYSIAMLDHGKLLDVVTAAGAIWHGRTLSRLIDKVSLSAALSLLGERTYRLAVAEADLAPRYEMDQLAAGLPTQERFLEDGRLCFLAWLDCLPAALNKRVQLKFEPGWLTGSPSPIHAQVGSVIVRKCGEALIHEFE